MATSKEPSYRQPFDIFYLPAQGVKFGRWLYFSALQKMRREREHRKRVSRYLGMTRRTDIIVTVDKIKLTRKLVANLVDFVRVARTIGYQPKYAETTLQRFREQLSNSREDLKRLTKAQPRLY